MKPRVFIGSSTKGLPVAEAVQIELSHDAEAVLWSQGVFRTTNVAIEDLMRAIDEYDFAIFVFLPEDQLEIRGSKTVAVRDNVLFELGLFLGKLGRQRNFFVAPKGDTKVDLHLPSDLSGITPATYDPKASNPQAAVGPALYEVKQTIRRLGTRGNQNAILYDSKKDFKQYDFAHGNSVFYDRDGRPASPKSDGSLGFLAGGVLEVVRRSVEGRYQIELRRDGRDKPSIAKTTTPPERVFQVSCEAMVDRGERTIRFLLKDEKANKWLDNDVRTISSTTWTELSVYLRVPATIDLLFRIDDEKPTIVPSSLCLRNLVIAEEALGEASRGPTR
jgi:hypothetical protein